MPPAPPDYRGQHMLADGEVYLNTGSWGSQHRRTFQTYIDGLRELEENPTQRHYRVWQRADDARARLAAFLGVPAPDVSFTGNVTVSMNMALLGYDWQPGDEILASDLEYGAIDNCLHQTQTRFGVTVRRALTPKPPASGADIVDAFARAWTPETRLLVVSHIISSTGTITPLAELARLAHERGARIAVDGAHAPGMIPLDLDATGVDLYGGNCHKWLCSPKGVGFLYAVPEVQERLRYLLVGWGYSQEQGVVRTGGGLMVKERPFMWSLDQWGSRDLVSLAATGTAVDVQEEIGRQRIAERGRQLSATVRQRLEATGWAECLTSADGDPSLSNSLTAWRLHGIDGAGLQQSLRDRWQITAPAGTRFGGTWLRVSTHYYNTEADIDVLMEALETLRNEA